MKRKIEGLIVLTFLLAYLGCTSTPIRISDKVQGPAIQMILLEETGYNVTFWILQNNPEYIEKVELGLEGVEKLLDAGDPTTAVRAVTEIMESLKIISSNYVLMVNSATRIVSLVLEINLEIADEPGETLNLIKAFVKGLRAGVEDAELVSELK